MTDLNRGITSNKFYRNVETGDCDVTTFTSIYFYILDRSQKRTCIVTMEDRGCEVTCVLFSNQRYYKKYLLSPRVLVFVPGIREAVQ